MFQTKDSGERQKYDSGMVRDSQDNKPRFDLITPEGQAYAQTMRYRHAMLMTRGMEKYGERNWENANSQEELSRFRQSAIRHLEQWEAGEDDEDHAAAVFFNVTAYEWLKEKIKDE